MFGNLQNSQGERLDYTVHPGQRDADQLAVIGHGVTGNKDRPFVIALADGLARAGIGVLRFSFSGNGQSGGRFVDSTITKEVADLGTVLEAMGQRRICYVGHSMGGAVGVIRASEDARITQLISLAGMVHTKAFAQREFGMVKPGGGNMWDDPGCPLSQAYMDDLAQLDTLVGRAKRIKVPWLLVHGTEDDVVPPQDAKDIRAQAGANAELVELPGANHVFAGDHTAPMVQTVANWVQRQFAA